MSPGLGSSQERFEFGKRRPEWGKDAEGSIFGQRSHSFQKESESSTPLIRLPSSAEKASNPSNGRCWTTAWSILPSSLVTRIVEPRSCLPPNAVATHSTEIRRPLPACPLKPKPSYLSAALPNICLP